MKKKMYVGKSVMLELQKLELISLYQNKTRKNFSQTLNIMLEQWDEYSLMMQKLKERQELDKEVDNLKNAEVIKK